MRPWEINQTIDLQKQSDKLRPLYGRASIGDVHAHAWNVIVTHGQDDVDIAGSTVSGSAINASGQTVLLTGSATANIATLLMPAEVYAVEGRVKCTMRISSGDQKITSAQIIIDVDRADTGEVVDLPIIPDLSELIVAAHEARSAAVAASGASTSATEAATNANASVNAANTATARAEAAADEATEAANDANVAAQDARDVIDDIALAALKTTVKDLAVSASSTGQIASLDGLIPSLPLDITVRAIATQEGSGDASPENKRRIVRQDAVGVGWSGTNLLRVSDVKSSTRNGVTIKLDDTGVFTLNGTAATQMWPDLTWDIGVNTLASFQKAVCLGGITGSLCIEMLEGNLDSGVSVTSAALNMNGSEVSLGNAQLSALGVKTIPYINRSFVQRVYLIIPAGAVLDNLRLRIWMALSPTATPYTPYTGSTHTITPDEPLFGLPGAPDEVRSDGTGARGSKYLELTGTEGWAFNANNTAFVWIGLASQSGISPPTDAPNIWSDTYDATTYSTLSSALVKSGISHGNPGYGDRLAIRDDRFSNVADFKAYLAAQATAGTPVQILYELATPQAITIAPFDVRGRGDVINVWSDGGGETTVSGYQSARYIYDTLSARLDALEQYVTNP